ncbi:putative tetratricopeptide repeat-containing domain protein, partial [Trichinella spiralis]|uniref:putative tetratricopeptide repeat-containing domain protein n=1 Tax=Trichinella spiralis TaxID=6334 RepID=UPI0001EFE34A
EQSALWTTFPIGAVLGFLVTSTFIFLPNTHRRDHLRKRKWPKCIIISHVCRFRSTISNFIHHCFSVCMH